MITNGLFWACRDSAPLIGERVGGGACNAGSLSQVMDPRSSYRPRISRETRLLLTVGLLAIVALWLLARLRFRDLPVTPNPIPAVLTQLASPPRHEDLAAEIAQVQVRLEASLLAIDLTGGSSAAPALTRVAGLRFRDDVAITFLAAAAAVDEAGLLAHDRASGLALVRVPSAPGAPAPAWTPRRMEQARYLAASEVSSAGVSLRPAFVGPLHLSPSALWSEPLWIPPQPSDLTPGSFLFTIAGAELAGLVVARGAERAIIPGAVLLTEAGRLLDRPRAPAGTIGIEVQPMTAPVAAATGARRGLIVTWIDGDAPAAGQLMVGDVIEDVDGAPLESREQWDIHLARLSAGETVTLRARRQGEIVEVALAAIGAVDPPVTRSLGLVLRARQGSGAEIVQVEPGSAGARAGLAAGDVITLVGDVRAPLPARVTRSFSDLGEGQRVLVAITRGDAHFVTTLER